MRHELSLRHSGKQAFVSGGSRGLGREMALALAEGGADIALVARGSDALETTATDIRWLGRKVWTFEVDLSDPTAAEELCARVLDEVGFLDIVVNNVGGRRVNVPIEDEDLATWRQLVDLNLTATFVCSRAFGAAMIEAGRGGRIINIASINGLVPGRGIGGRHYEAAKSAVIQFTRSLAVDWAQHGITANAICPGISRPNQTRSGRRHTQTSSTISWRTYPWGAWVIPRDRCARGLPRVGRRALHDRRKPGHRWRPNLPLKRETNREGEL